MKFLKYRYDLVMFLNEVLVSLYSLVLSVSNKMPFYLLPDFEVPISTCYLLWSVCEMKNDCLLYTLYTVGSQV